MDESDVMALIAEGETTGKVDCKRELHLESTDSKAEFIKDIIALANSAPGNRGYLLIGVNDDRYVVGIDELEEERIQQIVHKHIRPSIVLQCHMVPMHMPGCPSVGVIEIQGLERPHRVVRDIAGLRQDQVFIRHGSVVNEANPEEIRRMQDETEERRRGLGLIEAAGTHLSLGNFTDAIGVYTQAIRTMPTAALFLDRGKAYRCLIESGTNVQDVESLASQALKDLSDAIHLTSSDEVEKESRLERLRVFSLAHVEYEEWGEDVKWLRENTEGHRLGEVIYLDYRGGEDRVGFSSMEPDEVLAAMSEAIRLGYGEPGVYDLRSRANFYLFNYGLALHDINEAIKYTENIEERIGRLALRATIQVRMKRFREAHDSLLGAEQLSRQLPGKEFHGPWAERITSGIEEEILWRYGLESKFGKIEPYPASAVLSVLIAHMATKQIVSLGRSKGGKAVEPSRRLTGKSWIRLEFSPILRAIREIVGKDFWEQCEYLGRHGVLCWEVKENKHWE